MALARIPTDPFTMAQELLSWDPFRRGQLSRNSRELVFAPQVDVRETPDGYVIVADMPGVKEEDIDVHVEDGRLTLSGARHEMKENDDVTFHIAERHFGTFTRTFVLPREADLDKIEAKLERGVLTVTVPKRADAKPRKIEIKAG